jgi:hypothetical protein
MSTVIGDYCEQSPQLEVSREVLQFFALTVLVLGYCAAFYNFLKKPFFDQWITLWI